MCQPNLTFSKYLDGNWEKTSSCSEGKASCQSSTECGECLNETQQCDNEGLKICKTGKWDTNRLCECNQEGTDCKYDNGELRCRNIDDKSGIVEKYLDDNWEKTSSCSEGKASCKSSTECGECLNNEIECLDSGKSHYKICEDGKWSDTKQCNDGKICNDGTCKDSEPSPEECNPNSDSVRCNSDNNSNQLEFCNSDGEWEQVGPWGIVTQCVNDFVYYCTTDGKRESAKCADSCDGNASNSKCSECDPGKHAENCTSGKCNNENVNDWNNGTCIEDSGNGETLGLKEKCENSDGDFSSGECICKIPKSSNSSLFNNCKENDCNSLEECTPIDGNNKNELCFNNNLYVYCVNGWINELVYPNSRILNCYNENNIRKINEAVIRALINTMPDGCFPPYDITMGNGDCSLVYNNGGEFEYPSVDTCNGNLPNYQIKVTDGTEQCTVTNSNQNFKIETTECTYDTNGESSATFIASPDVS